MEYQTGQRKVLHDFFSAHPHDTFTAREIAAALSGKLISLSAIYRNLAAMAEEGHIRRSVKEGGREAVYQSLEGADCRNCLHMTCLSCGRVFHMSGAAARGMQELLSGTDGFVVDRARTVVYGRCRRCGEEGTE